MGLVGFVNILPWYTPSPERAPRTPSNPRDPSRPMGEWRVALRALATHLPSSLQLARVSQKLCQGVQRGVTGCRQLLTAANTLLSHPRAHPETFALFQTPDLSKILYSSQVLIILQHPQLDSALF